MSIIASAILAASIGIADLLSGINFAPIEDTEYGGSKTNEISCLTRSERKLLDEIECKVEILWAAHTNRLARVEAHKAANAERKSAIERVKNNVDKRKRRSVMPKNAGGVR